MRSVAVAGTFDLIHAGHESLFQRAFGLGETVFIGLTSDGYTARYKPCARPYLERLKSLRLFLEERGWLERARISPINDAVRGPACFSEELDGIVVSEETRQNAERINDVRRRRGLGPLEISVVPMVLGQNGKPLSSREIKNEKISAVP
jgi:pantetheine-phosphate adenylyltransferase